MKKQSSSMKIVPCSACANPMLIDQNSISGVCFRCVMTRNTSLIPKFGPQTTSVQKKGPISNSYWHGEYRAKRKPSKCSRCKETIEIGALYYRRKNMTVCVDCEGGNK